jgi:serine/threonine protein kinase
MVSPAAPPARAAHLCSRSVSASGSSSCCAVAPPAERPRSYLRPIQVGEVLAGRFELTRRAGAGGMGEIFHALDRVTGRPVAVKVLFDTRPTTAVRFAREAAVLASLQHPGVVGYVAHGEMPAGEPYLVMEWLEGEDLAGHLLRRGLTVRETLALGARVGDALGVLHARGIVHRDVKPGNILLVDGDVAQAKVLDLGLARVDELTRLTQADAVVGTLGYLAPEQAGSDRTIDARADVFSLGCVLFKCLTGESPFAAEGMMAQIKKILCDEAPRLRDRLPEIPEALDELIARMLSRNPDDRPRDGREAADALRALAATPRPSEPGETESAVPAPAGEEPVCSLSVSTVRCVRDPVTIRWIQEWPARDPQTLPRDAHPGEPALPGAVAGPRSRASPAETI